MCQANGKVKEAHPITNGLWIPNLTVVTIALDLEIITLIRSQFCIGYDSLSI